MNLIKELRKQEIDIISTQTINSVLNNKSVDAIKSYLKRACQKGDLIRLKNGLYLLGEDNRLRIYNNLEIANYLKSPSYVSLETALSYYNLIPEAVYTTTSVTTGDNLEQTTPIGHFSYSHLNQVILILVFIDSKMEIIITSLPPP